MSNYFLSYLRFYYVNSLLPSESKKDFAVLSLINDYCNDYNCFYLINEKCKKINKKLGIN